MTVINTNVASLYAQASLGENGRNLQAAMKQLSTGKRINTAADDPAGLATVSRLTSQINGLSQAVRNANDAINMLQTADGASDEVTSLLQRMRQLAVQSINQTYSTNDRTSMNSEFSSLYNEIKRVASTTQWNGVNILDGSMGSSGTVKFKVGSQSGAATIISATINSFNPDSTTTTVHGMSGLAGGSISSVSTASAMLGAINSAISGVNSMRSDVGAKINRLQFTVNNLTNISTNLQSSRSQIEDVDYSQATASLARAQVIQQAATAMLAQANQQPQLVLALLK
jgi:flagellin